MIERQCLLTKDGWLRIAWVPKSQAILNHFVDIKGEKNWCIIQVYISPFEEKWAKNKELNRYKTVVD